VSVVARGGMSIGHKGLVFSSKALAITMVDLFENEQLRKDIRAEFEKRKGTQINWLLISWR
jgi:aminobenzoyl-glutamate utilization protein B